MEPLWGFWCRTWSVGYRKVSMMDRPYRSSLWKELVIRQRPAVGSPAWKLWALSREVRSCPILGVEAGNSEEVLLPSLPLPTQPRQEPVHRTAFIDNPARNRLPEDPCPFFQCPCENNTGCWGAAGKELKAAGAVSASHRGRSGGRGGDGGLH